MSLDHWPPDPERFNVDLEDPRVRAGATVLRQLLGPVGDDVELAQMAWAVLHVTDAMPRWACGSCGQADVTKRYGGPADHDYEPGSPCEACVMASFAAHG